MWKKSYEYDISHNKYIDKLLPITNDRFTPFWAMKITYHVLLFFFFLSKIFNPLGHFSSNFFFFLNHRSLSFLTLQWFLLLIIFFHQFSFFKSPSKSKEYFSKRIYFSHLFFKKNLVIPEFCFPAENFFSPKRCCVYLRLRGIATYKPKLPEHSSQ